MAAARAFLALLRRRWILTSMIGVLAALILTLVGGRLWASSAGGRAYVLQRLDGAKAGRYGTIHADGLSGDLLGKLHLDRLSIADAEGDWLVIRNIDLDWAPMALLSNEIRVLGLDAAEVDLLRKPELSEAQDSKGGKAPKLTIRRLAVSEVALSEGVAGPEAHFNVAGQFEQAGRELIARLEATPKDSGGDHVKIDARRLESGMLHLDADIAGVPGGVLATLLSAPEGDGVTFTASVAGDIENATGKAALALGASSVATATLTIDDSRLTAESDIDVSRFAFVSDRVRSLTGDSLSLQLESTTRMRDAPFGLEARFPNGSLSARGVADTKAGALKGATDVDVRLADTRALLGHKSAMAFQGTAAHEAEGWALAGHATLTGDGSNTLPFSQLSGPVTVRLGTGDIAFQGALTAVDPFARQKDLARLFGVSSGVSVTGKYLRDTSQIDLQSAFIDLADGSVSAKGRIDPQDRSLDIRGTVETALGRLPGAMGGRISGPVNLHGPFDRIRIDSSLTSRGLSGLPDIAAELVGASPSAAFAMDVTPDRMLVDSLRLTGARATVTAAGSYAWSGSSDLRASLVQSAPVTAGGWDINLSAVQVQLAGQPGARRIILASRNGQASNGKQTLASLALDANLAETRDGLSGPVDVRATDAGTLLSANAMLLQQDGETRLDGITGKYGPGELSGNATLRDDGAIGGLFSVDGTALAWSGFEAASATGTVKIDKPAGDRLALEANLTAETVKLANASAPFLDKVIASVQSAPGGYNIRAQLLSNDPQRPTDLTFDAQAMLAGDAPSGVFNVSGKALGEAISTPTPAKWRLGTEPELNLRLSLLKGTATADFIGAGDTTRLVFDAERIDLSPVLAAFGNSTGTTELNGHGDLRVFGADPGGTFELVASSDVPGLDTSLLLRTNGTLTAQAATFHMESDYGGKLSLRGDGQIPVISRAGHLVQPDRTSPLTGQAALTGDLSVLRTIALAFGHDAGGQIDAQATLSGTLEAPHVTADARIADGVYEFGATGFRITGVSLDSRYEDHVLTVKADGRGPGGGSVSLDGKLAGDDTNLTARLKEILIYNRDGDYIRTSGDVVLADNPDDRTLTGDLFIDQARLSIDNLPSARPHALDVRWEGDPPPSPETSRIRRTLGLDVRLKADRRVMIDGRGLDSEWRLDLKATGTPAELKLNGAANLVRGNLDLAGRPFVFDTGRIDFDGPPSRARIAVSAERSVNGFDARVDVSGSPTLPVFELSSTPDLPQDEILSRLLFGRSSMDLSPLEAAQLASSIAKFSGRSSGFDPVSGVGAALGLDHFSLGTSETGAAQVGVGQYLSDDVYLQLKSAGAEGSSVEVEWQPKPQVSVTSETHTNGENKVSVRWKRDY
ncbi:MAG: translocation/assembly module TamB domain-containing protein [Hyphomonas sp.]